MTSRDRATAVLWSVRRKGARLWLDQQQVRFDAPKGALTLTEMDKLRSFKSEIAEILRAESSGIREYPAIVPLSYSQMAHWKHYRLWERPAIRHVASAMRLLGELRIDSIRECLEQVVLRHDALRARIVVIDGEPFQEIGRDAHFDLTIDDVSNTPCEGRAEAVSRLIDEHIRQPIDLAVDPPFAVRISKVAPDEHLLVLAMEHIVSDAMSLAIVSRDLFTAYAKARHGDAAILPPLGAQFSDYAIAQCHNETEFTANRQIYWREELAGGARLRFAPAMPGENRKGLGAGQVPVNIAASIRNALQDWARANRTTVPMAAFACFAAVLLWRCGVSEGLFPYIVNGRDHGFENTVGCFASAIYIKVTIHPTDSLRDVVSRVVSEYCRAFEFADRTYLEARSSPPEVIRNSSFNWIAGDATLAARAEQGIAHRLVSFDNPVMELIEFDREPSMMLSDSGAQLNGCVVFARHRLSRRAMEAFADEYVQSLQALIGDPDTPIAAVFLEMGLRHGASPS